MASKAVGFLTFNFGANMDGFNKAMKKAQRGVRKFGSSMKSMGKSMTTNMTMPLLAVGAAGVKLAVDFGTSMAKIRTLVGASASDLKAYEKQVLAISQSTGVAADQLAEGLFFITSAGLSGKEAIEALEISAKGAAMGMGEMADIGNALTSIMTAYASEGMTAAKGGDLLHETLKQGKFEASEFMQKLGKVIPTAAAAGVSFEELGAASATMSKLSGDASGTLTSMNSLMMKLLNPSQQQKEILEEIGISAEDLGTMMDDSLMGTLQFLFKNLEGNNEMLMKVFGSSKAVTGALSTMGLQSETYAGVLDRMNDSQGNVSEGMEILAETSGFKMQKALNSVKLVLMDIGDKVMPLVLKMVRKVEAGMQWWQSLAKNAKTTAISIGLFLAALGPAITLVGSLATAFAFLASPIGLVVAAIVAIVVAFAYVRENWEAFKERLGDWAWWKNALIQALQWVIEYSPISLLIKGFNKLATFLGRDPIVNPFETMADGLEDLKEETKEYENEFGSFGDAMKNQASELGDALGAMGGSIGVGTGGGEETEEAPIVEIPAIDTKPMEDALEVVEDATDDATENLKGSWDEFFEDWKEGIEKTVAVAQRLMGSLSGVVSAINEKEMTEFQNMRNLKDEAMQEDYDKELAAIENSTANEEAKKEAIAQLDEKYNKKKEESNKILDAKESAIKRKQAKRDKKLNIMNAIISTAAAVAAALPVIPLSIAVGIMGAAQVGLIASTPIPAFEDGGIISGPTVGLMGEYAGAKNNPEVVAPLNKLKGMMGSQQQNIIVEGRISGNDIYISNSKTSNQRDRLI